MTERFVITKISKGIDWNVRETVCSVDDYHLASNIVAWLYVHDGEMKDEEGFDVEAVYIIDRQKHFTTLEDFVKSREGEWCGGSIF